MRQRQPKDRAHLRIALLGTSALVALSLAPVGAQAQTSTWTGATDSNYGTASNWTGGTPPPTSAGKSALFDDTGNANPTVNVAAPITVQNWTFDGSTGYTVAGSAVTFSGAGAGLANTSSASQTVGNVLAGSGATVVQNGFGTLTLSGANTFSGGTTLSSGTLIVTNSTPGVSGSLGTGAVTMDGGTLQVQDQSPSPSLSLQFNNQIKVTGNGGTIDNKGNNLTLAGNIVDAGPGASFLQFQDTSFAIFAFGSPVPTVTTLSGNNSGFSGGVAVSFSALQVTNNNALGTNFMTLSLAEFRAGADNLRIANDIQLTSAINGSGINSQGFTFTLSGVISDQDSFNPGSLTFLGAPGGKTVLTNTNTYGNGTTICNCATLQLGEGGTAGSILNAIANDGTLIFNRSNTYDTRSLNNTISGSGNVVQAGTGTTIFGDGMTYTGTTTILAGTLQIGAGGAEGSIGSGAIVNNGTLAINKSNAFSLANGITGTGGLDQIGTGTTTLSGTNTYTGATNVNAGSLKAGAANAFAPSSAFTVASGATLDLASLNQTIGSLAGAGAVTLGSATLTLGGNGASTSYSGAITGTGGALVKVGAGTLFLSGANTYTGATTVSGGTLGVVGSITSNVTNSATLLNSGSITGTVLNSGQFSNGFGRVHGDLTNSGNADIGSLGGGIDGRLINNGGSVSMGRLSFVGGGVVLNGGDFTNFLGTVDGGAQVNAGSFNNSGSVNGGATVNGGVLSNNGTIDGNVTVNSSGTFGGIGTVNGNVAVNKGGTLSPGNSIGLITINGNLVLGAGAIYKVEVSPTDADRTRVTGNANIAGSTLVLAPAGGTYTIGKKYTLLNASGGVSGTFSTGDISGLFGKAIKASVSYDASNAFLNLDPNALSPFLVSAAPNLSPIAGAIDKTFQSGQTPALFVNLFNLTAAQLPVALDQLSGEVHASTAGLLADESLYARSAILGRLRQASYGGDSGTMAALNLGGPQAFADGRALDSALAYAKSPIVTKAPMRAPQAAPDIVFWAQGFGAWGRFSGDGNAATVNRDLAGFFTGVDTRVGASGRAGVAAGYTSAKNALDGRGTANVESGHVAAYGGWSFGALNLRAGGGYGFHTIATDRTVAFPGVFDRAFANYDGNTGQIFGEAGYGFALGNVAVEPFAGGAWVRVHTDAAAERALAAGLNFAGTTFEVGYSSLGIRAASLLPLDSGMVLIPRAALAWQHAFNSVRPDAVLAFQVAPAAPFTISGVPIARDALLAEAGIDLALNAHATIGVSYTGQVANNVQDHAAKGRFAWKF